MRILYQSYVDYENGAAYWDRLRPHLDRLADPGTRIDIRGITPYDNYAHPLVEWRCGREMICNAVEAEQAGYDAFIVGHFQDSGLYEARSAVGIPVIGLGETAMLHACTLGQRIGLVTPKPRYISWFRQQVAKYGLERRVAAIHPVSLDAATFAAAWTDPEAEGRLHEQFADQTRALVADGIDVLVPTGGGPMVLMSGLGAVDGAPVLDGVAVAVKMAEVAVKLRRLTGLSVSRVSEFFRAPPDIVEEFMRAPTVR